MTDALHIANSAGTNLSGNVTAPATGGYQTWTTVTVTVTLAAGTQTLTVDQDNAGWNINYLAFATSGGGGGGGGYGGFPAAFWGNTSSIPTSSNAIEFDFINATNGQYPDSEVYWSVNGVDESIAQSPYYTMASCTACRVYFYLGSTNSQYNDFIELNSSGTTINADTSRVDAFGLPLAIHLHNSNGTDTVVGRGRPGLRREQDRPVHAVRELRAGGVQAARHRERALQHPVAERCRGLPAGRRGRRAT